MINLENYMQINNSDLTDQKKSTVGTPDRWSIQYMLL